MLKRREKETRGEVGQEAHLASTHNNQSQSFWFIIMTSELHLSDRELLTYFTHTCASLTPQFFFLGEKATFSSNIFMIGCKSDFMVIIKKNTE